MNKNLSLLVYAIILISSCKNEVNIQSENLTNDQILTKVKTWKFEKARSIVNGTASYYERNENDTTMIPFSQCKFNFNEDGTGFLTNGEEAEWPFTFTWLNIEKTKLKMIIKQKLTFTVLWENILINEKKLSYVEFIDHPERLSLSYIELTPYK
ncbi:MAG: hypothetical protein IPK61_05325 [Saprospiraceae bacterium]|nr:hypothetical protein [Saprospiraceae bacterium]